MKINKTQEQNEHEHQVRHLAAIRQNQQDNHKHHLKAMETAKMEETRIQRNRRLSMPKGQNVDIDC